MTPTVHIIDDDAAIRDALALLLEANGYRVKTHDSAVAALPELEEGREPGCVVADVRMPGMSGLDLQRELNAKAIALPVIIITGHGDVTMAVQALKAGASDFIEKPFDEDVLLQAIAQALDHGARFFRERREVEMLKARLAELTPREREVMDLVVQGSPNKAVAGVLGISVRTVEIHRARVMEKMAANNLSELVRMALRLEDGGGFASA